MTGSDKFSFTKAMPELYGPKKGQVAHLVVPQLTFIAIDGEGSPNGPDFQAAMAALYSVAYTLKFLSKTQLAKDYVVPPAEGLWWADNPESFATGAQDDWRWSLLSAVPSWIHEEEFERALGFAQKKSAEAKPPVPGELRALSRAQFLKVAEGECLQTLHVGPYSSVSATLDILHNQVMPAEGLTFNGPHHEIYLSNPSRTAPEKIKTVLRQPVRPL
jgi:hypothetical protein